MQAEDLRAMQAPFKQRYREAPESALITLSARGNLDVGLTCSVETGQGPRAGRLASRHRR